MTDLGEQLLVRLCSAGLGAKDLGRLEIVARFLGQKQVFQTPDGATAMLRPPEFVAQTLVHGRSDGWRVQPCGSESWKLMLHLLEPAAGGRWPGRLSPLRSSSDGHTIEAGALFAFGRNNSDQRLGLGDSTEMVLCAATKDVGEERTRVALVDGVADVVTLRSGGCCLTKDGGLYTWGSADRGKLGHCAVADIPKAKDWRDELHPVVRAPRLVIFSEGLPAGNGTVEMVCWPVKVRVAIASMSDGHTACVTDTGKLFTFGANGSGQLGLGEPTSFCQGTPRHVTAVDERVVSVCCSGGKRSWGASSCGSTVIVTVSSTVLMCGTVLTTTDAAVSADDHDGGEEDELPHTLVPKQISFPAGVVIHTVSSCDSTFAAVATDGSLFTWGEGRDFNVNPEAIHYAAFGAQGQYPDTGVLGHGQLSDGFEPSPKKVQRLADKGVFVTDVMNTGYYMAAVGADGSLWVWGDSALTGGNGLSTYDQPGEWFSNPSPTKITNIPPVQKVISLLRVQLTSGEILKLGDGKNGTIIPKFDIPLSARQRADYW